AERPSSRTTPCSPPKTTPPGGTTQPASARTPTCSSHRPARTAPKTPKPSARAALSAPSASTTPSPPPRNTASGAAPTNGNAEKSASREGSTSERNPPAERSPDTAATKTATNPPAPNAKPRWPDTRHAGDGSRTPSGERPRHEDSGKTRQKEGTAMTDTQATVKFDQYGRYVLPDPE